MKKRKPSKKLLCLSAVFLVFLVCCAVINMRFLRFDDDAMYSRLDSLSSYNQKFFSNIVNRQYSSLQIMANSLAAEEDIHSSSAAQRLNMMAANTNFSNLIIYDESGTAFSNNLLVGNFKDEAYFKNALLGIKSLQYADKYNRDSLMFCVPIYTGNQSKGVLAGIYPIQNMHNELLSLGNNLQNIFIMDENMNIIFRKGSTVFSIDTGDIVKLKNAFHSHEDITFCTTLNNRRCLMQCKYLNINDWYMITYTPIQYQLSRISIFVNLSVFLAFLFCTVLITHYIRSQQKKYYDLLARTHNETLNLAKSIPGGAFSCRLDENLTIIFHNEGLLEMLGCKKEDFAHGFGHKFIPMIAEEDLNEFMYLYNKHYNTYIPFEYTCRLVKKDQTQIWVFGKSQFTRDVHDDLILYTVLIDITNQKYIENKLRLSEERYKILLEQSKSVIFEYNIINQENFVTPNFYEMFGVAARNVDMFTLFLREDRVYEKDMPLFNQILDSIYTKNDIMETELRIRDASGKYKWYLLRMKSINQLDGTPVRTVGNLTDIDAQKRSTQHLITRAQIDGLTGCYNKTTATELVKQFIDTNKDTDADGALAIIDIDYFKSINDSLGHAIGDEVLKKIGQHLRTQVRSSDIVGRIGGDEFLVFLKFTSSHTQITSRMQSIINDVRKIPLSNGESLTVSIGVSTYPQQGMDYHTLFDKADKALYLSKTHGRNQFTIYPEEN